MALVGRRVGVDVGGNHTIVAVAEGCGVAVGSCIGSGFVAGGAQDANSRFPVMIRKNALRRDLDSGLLISKDILSVKKPAITLAKLVLEKKRI